MSITNQKLRLTRLICAGFVITLLLLAVFYEMTSASIHVVDTTVSQPPQAVELMIPDESDNHVQDLLEELAPEEEATIDLFSLLKTPQNRPAVPNIAVFDYNE